MTKEPYDAGEPSKVQKGKQKARNRRDVEVDGLRQILATRHGREFIWDIIVEAGVYDASFCGEETHRTAFFEGKRDIGLRLIKKVFTADKNVYTLMQHEAEQRENPIGEVETEDA